MTSSWAGSGGFLNLQGGSLTRSGSKFRARITQPAARGTTTLYVNTTANINAGDWVRLWMLDLDATRTATRRLLSSSSDDNMPEWDLDEERELATLAADSRQLLSTPSHTYLPGSLDLLRRSLAISLSDPEITPVRLAALKRMAARAARLANPAAFKRAGFHAAAVDGTIVAWIYGNNLVDSGPLDWQQMSAGKVPVRFAVQ